MTSYYFGSGCDCDACTKSRQEAEQEEAERQEEEMTDDSDGCDYCGNQNGHNRSCIYYTDDDPFEA